MQDSSDSSPAKQRDRSGSQEKRQFTKLFITNIDGKADLQDIENDLRKLFEKHGNIENLVAKRNRNSEYCFAFVEMKDHAVATECVKAYDQSYIGDKQIKVEFQDDTKRRKDSNKGCYNCGKMGHFSRECHSSRNDDNGRDGGRGGYRRRSPSRSVDSYRRHKKHKRRHRSGSNERGRSRSPQREKRGRRREDEDRNDRKHRSRDRDEKRKKRHKRDYSSRSRG